jgi:hypothetical protein
LQQRKGGSMWGTGSYDPELNLIFWGTAPPIPHSELARGTGPGAHLYTNSTLAIDPDTGKIVWHFQHLPGDNWNLDHAFERILVDVEDGNDVKRVLLTAGKTGIVWALDRKTGRYLWHRETVHQDVISSIDPNTGAVTLNREVVPTALGQKLVVCPSLYGGRIWQASAYSPETSALFMPLVYELTSNPSLRDWLKEDWSRASLAIEEFLRFISPVQFSKPRFVCNDVELGGVRLRKGEKFMAMLAAANMDPDANEHPERLDLERRPNRHLAFGTGIHFCLGHQLARIKGKCALEALFTRWPKLALAIEPSQIRWRGRPGLRAIEKLPVAGPP